MADQNIIKIALLEVQDKKILSTRTKGKDTFYLPGGKPEHNETPSETLIRECKEELDIDINPNTILPVGTFSAQAHSHPVGVLVEMMCFSASYAGVPKPSAEIEEIRWLTYADKPIVSPVDKIIFDQLRNDKLL